MLLSCSLLAPSHAVLRLFLCLENCLGESWPFFSRSVSQAAERIGSSVFYEQNVNIVNSDLL